MSTLILGEDNLTQGEYDALWQYRAEHGLSNLPPKLAHYWKVWHQHIDVEKATQELEEAYKSNQYVNINRAFVIREVDLAETIIRQLPWMDFVYDIKTGLIFMDLFGGHEALMGQIYECITNKSMNWEDGAELYVQKGYGIFRSSQSKRIMIGEATEIPSWLKSQKALITLL